MVRDEQDVLETNLRHHLDLGIDEVLVVDGQRVHRSEQQILQLVTRTIGRVRWGTDAGDHRHRVVTTELAREAVARGADGVIVVDADEFWVVDGDLKAGLAATSAGVLTCAVVNLAQRRSQLEGGRGALRHMKRRVDLNSRKAASMRPIALRLLLARQHEPCQVDICGRYARMALSAPLGRPPSQARRGGEMASCSRSPQDSPRDLH
jgi:hypothetical protein